MKGDQGLPGEIHEGPKGNKGYAGKIITTNRIMLSVKCRFFKMQVQKFKLTALLKIEHE